MQRDHKHAMTFWIMDKTQTLFAQNRPQALQRDLGPAGPRRIIGVHFELVPQCIQLIESPQVYNC